MEEQSNNDMSISEVFLLLNIESPNASPVIRHIIEYMTQLKPDRNALDYILNDFGIENLKYLKLELLDLLLGYINIILKNNEVSVEQKNNIKYLKMLFKIKEGDFYKFRYHGIKQVILQQLEFIYRDDNKVNKKEASYKVDLQGLFDLSYDQFLEFDEIEIRFALKNGADVMDLDTVRRPSNM